MCQQYDGERSFVIALERRQRREKEAEVLKHADEDLMIEEVSRRLEDKDFRKKLSKTGFRIIRGANE